MKRLSLSLQTGISKEVTLRGLGPMEFEEAAKAAERGDFMRLMDMTAGEGANFCQLLSPESFSTLLRATNELNVGVFECLSARAMLSSLRDPRTLFRSLPPEVLVEMIKLRKLETGDGKTTSPN